MTFQAQDFEVPSCDWTDPAFGDWAASMLRSPNFRFCDHRIQLLLNISVSDLNCTTRVVVVYLASHASAGEGRCIVSDETVAKLCKLSSRTVQKVRRDPEFLRFFHVTPGSRKGRASEYLLTEYAFLGAILRKEIKTRSGARHDSEPIEDIVGDRNLPSRSGTAHVRPMTDPRHDGHLCSPEAPRHRPTTGISCDRDRVVEDPEPESRSTFPSSKGERNAGCASGQGESRSTLKKDLPKEEEKDGAVCAVSVQPDGTRIESRTSASSPLLTQNAEDLFIATFPRKDAEPKARQAFRWAVDQGEDPIALIAGAHAYAKEIERTENPAPLGAKRWVEERLQQRVSEVPKDPAQVKAARRKRHVEGILKRRRYLLGDIKTAEIKELIESKDVTHEDCRQVQLRW